MITQNTWLVLEEGVYTWHGLVPNLVSFLFQNVLFIRVFLPDAVYPAIHAFSKQSDPKE
jgi:hypothetical protein